MATKENSPEDKQDLNQVRESDIVLCTVTGIENTVVFIKTDSGLKGSIAMSEIAAGRIRNLREYVILNKKIVCKVLKVFSDHIELSLRRVTGKEREEAVERDKKEKALFSLLKGTTKNSDEILAKIRAKHDLFDFYEELKANPSLITEFLSKVESEKFLNLLKEKEDTEKKVKKTIILKTLAESGLDDIKSILTIKDVNIHYLGSAQYSIEIIGKDFKEANTRLNLIIQKIELDAKSKRIQFELKETK